MFPNLPVRHGADRVVVERALHLGREVVVEQVVRPQPPPHDAPRLRRHVRLALSSEEEEGFFQKVFRMDTTHFHWLKFW